MNVTVEEVNSVKKIMHVEVAREQVERELDKAYEDVKRKAKIKGFRPGKAPRSLIERMYKKDVHDDVSQKLIQESFIDALKQTGLDIIGLPRIEPPEIRPAEPLRYAATVEVRPQIADIDFNGIDLTKNRYRVTDGEMDAQLQLLRKNMAQLKPLAQSRPVAEGDHVMIDYEGFKDGNPFEETQKTDNFTLQVGSGKILKDFDSQLIGMVPGDVREFDLTFPGDYFNPKLAGQSIRFCVTLHEIREQILPPMDDELAKQMGPFQTVDDLKKAIAENLTEGYRKRVEHELNEQVFQALIAKTSFDLPDILVDEELEHMIRDTMARFSAQNLEPEKLGITPESLQIRYRPTAEAQVRRHLLLGKIIEQEKLTLDEGELEKGYGEMGGISGATVENIKEYYKANPERLAFFKHTLLEKKAIDLIIGRANVKEVEPELAPAAKDPAAKADEPVNG